MNVVSLKEYAKNNGISYEAVRQQVVRYASELEGHIIKDGRQQFLDDDAVAFLDGKRQKNPVVVYQMEKDEEIERLTDENKTLLIKIAAQADQIAELAQWKAENAMLIAEAKNYQALTSAAEERATKAEERAKSAETAKEAAESGIEELTVRAESAEYELKQIRAEARKNADEAEKERETRYRAEAEAEDVRQREADLKAIIDAPWWKRKALRRQFDEKWGV